MKRIATSLIGMVFTFYYKHIPWTAADFRMDEEVEVVIDGMTFVGTVTGIVSYGVDVRIERA